MWLKAKNFACLENVEVEFRNYTIFIGEQASGKSVTCKLYYFFREAISNKITSALIDDEGWKYFLSDVKDEFYSIFPEYSWKDSDFNIAFGDEEGGELINISYKRGNKSVSINFSNYFKDSFKSLKSRYGKLKKEIDAANNSSDELPFLGKEYSYRNAFRKAYKETQLNNFLEDVTYIPSGRAFFSVIRDNVFGFLSENIGIDPFLKSFGQFFEFSKRISSSPSVHRTAKKIDLAAFDKLTSAVLKGVYLSEKKEDWLVSSGKKIQLSNASSGQQEALPMLLCLRSLLLTNSSFGRRSIVVEEPEAHLFPSSQKTVIELIFLTSNMGANANFIVTTHSPYVLSCINNEMLRSQASSSEKLSAYYLSAGKSYNIVDSETGLIDGNELDKISTVISEEFYEMLESIQ